MKNPLLFLFGFLLLVFIILPNIAFGGFIFEDDFESYNFGDIGGQGDWTVCESKAETQVSNLNPYEGIKSYRSSDAGGNQCCERVGSQVAIGLNTFWVKIIIDAEGADASYLIMGQWIDDTQNPISFGQVRFGANGHIHWTTQEATYNFLCDTGGEYTEITFNWDATENKVKYDCLGLSSGWVDVSSYSTIDFDYFNVIRTEAYLNRVAVHIDNIGEPEPVCEIGTCGVCSSFEDCENAGCYWNFYGFVPGFLNYCIEPLDPSDCGSFLNCQFCETQETCENDISCEWKDYGQGHGVQCYWKQPLTATSTIEWAVAELDDCSALSGVEKWVCETKNFIAGIFLPTQAKMTVFYNTMTDFRQKFPFNYINIGRDFFADIKNDIVDDNEISIEILGNEASLDFSFWNATTSVAGAVQSYKNIFYGFTNILLGVVFFVWLIAFLRRFF